jgi:hypothetical protein
VFSFQPELGQEDHGQLTKDKGQARATRLGRWRYARAALAGRQRERKTNATRHSGSRGPESTQTMAGSRLASVVAGDKGGSSRHGLGSCQLSAVSFQQDEARSRKNRRTQRQQSVGSCRHSNLKPQASNLGPYRPEVYREAAKSAKGRGGKAESGKRKAESGEWCMGLGLHVSVFRRTADN